MLGYVELRSSGGPARHFQRGEEDPLTFHEPHGGKTIKQGTLTEYLRKLDIDRDMFMAALGGTIAVDASVEDEEKFHRKEIANGILVSNCLLCCELVATGSEHEVKAAEDTHACPTSLAMS